MWKLSIIHVKQIRLLKLTYIYRDRWGSIMRITQCALQNVTKLHLYSPHWYGLPIVYNGVQWRSDRGSVEHFVKKKTLVFSHCTRLKCLSTTFQQFLIVPGYLTLHMFSTSFLNINFEFLPCIQCRYISWSVSRYKHDQRFLIFGRPWYRVLQMFASYETNLYFMTEAIILLLENPQEEQMFFNFWVSRPPCNFLFLPVYHASYMMWSSFHHVNLHNPCSLLLLIALRLEIFAIDYMTYETANTTSFTNCSGLC